MREHRACCNSRFFLFWGELAVVDIQLLKDIRERMIREREILDFEIDQLALIIEEMEEEQCTTQEQSQTNSTL
jgi:hypothetical protein